MTRTMGLAGRLKSESSWHSGWQARGVRGATKQRSQRSVQAENQLRDSLICMFCPAPCPPTSRLPRKARPSFDSASARPRSLMRPAVSVRASGRHSRHHVVTSLTVEIMPPENAGTVVENGISTPRGVAKKKRWDFLSYFVSY